MRLICRLFGHRYVSVNDWLAIPTIRYCLRCGHIKPQQGET